MPPLRRPEQFAATRKVSPEHPLRSATAILFAVCVLLLCSVLLPSSPLQAQTATSGAISGHLRANSPADISARDNATGLVTHTQATRAGDFLLTPLPPGDYALDIASEDLPAWHADHVPVALGTITPVFPTSEPTRPGSHPIDPAVSADQPTAEPELPIELRTNPDSESESEALPTVRGLAATQNQTLLDGAAQTQIFSATPYGSGAAIDPEANPEDSESTADTSATSRTSTPSRSVRSAAVPYAFARSAVREFHLTGDLFSALYGGAPGGILTAVTRSGAAHLHGSAFLTLRNSAFAATNPYAIATTYTTGTIVTTAVKPNDVRQQFGGTLSGPIPRTRHLFFFAALDAQRRGFPAISSPQDPNFYALTPTQRALLANRGVRTAAIASALTYLDSLTGPAPRRADGNVAFAKLDAHPLPRLTASLEYNRARWSQPAGLLSAPVVARARASIGNTADHLDTATARILTPITPLFSNELILQYAHNLQSQSPQTPLPQEPAIGPGSLPPEVAIGPQGLTFGTPAALGRSAYPDERRLQLADHLSFLHRRHHLQTGFDFATTDIFVSALTNQEGTFTYDSLPTTPGRAGGLVDWITDFTFNVNAYPNGGCPSITAPIHLFCFRSFAQSFGQQSVAFNTQHSAAFLQDDLRLTSFLTLHAGLRYDYQLLPIPQQPNPALETLFGVQASTAVFPEDRNNLAPRLALSYQPSRTLILRAGYGIFFGTVPGATLRTALLSTDLPASTTHIRILPSAITACPQVANQGFGYPCDYLLSPASALPTTTSAVLFSRRFRLPMVQQGTVAVEQELPRRITLTATYRINLDRQLPTSTDLNIAPPTVSATYQLQGGLGLPGIRDGETFALPLYTARVTNIVGPVTAITSTANATYHGLQLEARRRARDLSFAATLTWSKAIDFAPTQGAIPQANRQLDPFNLRFDKALSALNFPYTFLAEASWQPALTTPDRTLRLAANGWSVTPILYARSGTPYSLTLSGGSRLPGGHESINGSGGATYLPTVGRNTFRLPPSINLDLRLARTLRVREHLDLRLTAEAYNLANHVNIAGITQRAYLAGTPIAGVTPLVFQNATTIAAEGLNNRPFGAFTDSGTNATRARQLQLGLRLEF